MIGIDITRISRFEKMKHLEKFLKKFSVDGTTPLAAAKTWACLEALFKAGCTISNIRIKFPNKAAPQIEDISGVLKNNYQLTLSHEGDLVVAVALKLQ
jgi:phosphopantetheinyl transferase (holo-ACP synthase)